MIDTPERWKTVGEALSTARGDAQQLDVKMRSQVQRVDRAIQTAERFNDRGHILYCAVTLPHQVPQEAVQPALDAAAGIAAGFRPPHGGHPRLHELDPTLGEREWCSRSKTTAACIWAGRTRLTTPHTCCRGGCGSRWSRPVRGVTVARTGASAGG